MLRCAFHSLLLAVVLVGCSSESTTSLNTQPAAVPNADGLKKAAKVQDASAIRLEQQKLDADTLANMLGIKAWKFAYSGGPVRCWLDVEEIGQKTMPSRLPEQGVVESDDAQGAIVLWWRETPYQQREIRLTVGGNAYSYHVGNEGFHYGWKRGTFGRSTPQGQEKTIGATAGEEVELMSYEVSQSGPVEENGKPREVTIRLKALFSGPTE